MIESFIPIVIAVCSGAAVLTSRVNNRISEMDNRVDRLELRIVETYVTKGDFQNALERVEGAMIRMEDKLDSMIQSVKK